jgi:hypothetical protein
VYLLAHDEAGAVWVYLGRKLAVLGSVSPEGFPQAALVGIAVSEELEIVFDTLDTTRKFRNLTANCRASFVIGWGGREDGAGEGLSAQGRGIGAI